MTRRATRVERLVEFRPVDLFLETFLPRDNLPVDLVQPFSHICHSAWSALDQMEYQPWFLSSYKQTPFYIVFFRTHKLDFVFKYPKIPFLPYTTISSKKRLEKKF